MIGANLERGLDRCIALLQRRVAWLGAAAQTWNHRRWSMPFAQLGPLRDNNEETARDIVPFYHPELDVMRFLAFALVFVHHILPRKPGEYLNHTTSRFAADIFAAIANATGFGLNLFFFLSAFLITFLLVIEKDTSQTVSIADFYIRRILRIWPLYVVCLGIAVTFNVYELMHNAPVEPGAWLMLAMYAMMIGNWFFAAGLGRTWPANPMTPLWSISVEEQFYALWPWLVRAAGQRGVICASATMLVSAVAVEGYLGNAHAERDVAIWTNTFVCFEFFAVGALCAVWFKTWRVALSPGSRCLVLACAAGAWLAANLLFGVKAIGPAPGGWSVIAGNMLVAVGCVGLLTAIWGWTRWHRALIRLGRISYGLYCFHLLALMAVNYAFADIGHGLRGEVVKAGMAFALAVAMAELSYRYLETPFLRLKERFAAVRSRPV